jgi:hypothetical protein
VIRALEKRSVFLLTIMSAVLDAESPAMGRLFRDFHGVFAARVADEGLASAPEVAQVVPGARLGAVAGLSRRYRAVVAAAVARMDEQLDRCGWGTPPPSPSPLCWPRLRAWLARD